MNDTQTQAFNDGYKNGMNGGKLPSSKYKADSPLFFFYKEGYKSGRIVFKTPAWAR